MRSVINYITSLCAVVITVSGVAKTDRPYYFRSLEVENGLSQNMVYCIIQDACGFMWFGTQDGLNRYDGQNFRVYKKDPSNANSIGSNSLFSMLEDKKGMIWLGTMMASIFMTRRATVSPTSKPPHKTEQKSKALHVTYVKILPAICGQPLWERGYSV